jgi:hypothetical protein
VSRMVVRVLGGVVTAGLAGSLVVSSVPASAGDHANAQHVLLLSVDGLHQTDLDWYVNNHPQSALAQLVNRGTDYKNAQTPFPSDSFPGIVGQLTGGNPKSTGAYYDDSWNAGLLPAGTSVAACQSHSVKPGVEVQYMELAAKDPTALDSGQGLPGLPNSILQLTPDATSLLDPATLPVDPTTCKPVYPHDYLQVNTVFQVVRQAGLRTAWSDKHAAYEVLNGPSNVGVQGVQDFFTPEINSTASAAGNDWTTDNALTQTYDSYKVQAILNEIDGYDHSRSARPGTPAIFGMNFQTVSTAQKLPAGGYMKDGVTPSALLSTALDYINAKVGAMLNEIRDRDMSDNTVVILSAKHGQSPQDPAKLTRISDGAIVDALNQDWVNAGHPGTTLVDFSINDDGMLMWLSDRSDAATTFVKNHLMSSASPYKGTGNDITGNPKPYTTSGLTKVYAGSDPQNPLFVPASDTIGRQRTPDIVGIAQVGTVYTGKKAKISEHGGDNPQDRNVPIVVSGAGVGHKSNSDLVETTQIAPTILQLLGLDPQHLDAVKKENTQVLPDLGGDQSGDNTANN